MHFGLDEEHKLLQDLVARFVRENLMPLEQKVLERDASGHGAYLSLEERDRIDCRLARDGVVGAERAGGCRRGGPADGGDDRRQYRDGEDVRSLLPAAG